MKYSPLKGAQQQRQKARALGENARDKRARAHQALAKTRRLLKDSEAIFQHTPARREHQAEQAAASATTAPRPGIDIVLIEDTATDVTLFRHALTECALSCQLTVLTQRSDVETFVRQAASSAPFSPPQLIIADCLIPGMEAEEILAALRTVPAYQRIPVILFSSLEEEEGQRRRLQCGATGFVRKPGELEAFVRAVSTMVRRWGGVSESTAPASAREARSKAQDDGQEPSAG
jgi:CheY-like chemotaxis protein